MKKQIGIILFSCLLLLVGACKKSKIEKVKIASYYEAVDYAPFLIAKKKKWFDEKLKDDGIAVVYDVYDDLGVINDDFLAGNLDVVFEAGPPAIISEAADIGIDVLDISCSLVQEILVTKNSEIKTIHDLKGKNIAVLSGSSSHYGVLKLLEDVNIKSSEVTLTDAAPMDAKVAFETGQYDAWAVWPPFVEQQILNGKGRILPKGDVFIHSIMAVREELVEDYPEIYKQIDEVFDRSKAWIKENEKEAIKIIADELKIKVEEVEMAWSKHDWSATLNNKVVKDLQNKADFLISTKKIVSPLNVSEELIPKSALKK